MLDRIDDLGGKQAFNYYAWGWAWAGNTPFRLWKRYSWLGGVRVPLVVHWPAGIPDDSKGSVRGQLSHAIDVMPTILEATGVEMPETIGGTSQIPLDGKSNRRLESRHRPCLWLANRARADRGEPRLRDGQVGAIPARR
jgi:arylsulfatase A-like enzyme